MSVTKDIMTPNPITIQASESLTTAYRIMHAKNIRHLPVVDERNKVVGILSDRDLQRAMQVRKISNFQQELQLDASLKVEEFMSWPVYTVAQTTSIKRIAEEMLTQKVSAFLVEDDAGRMRGIVTTDDLIKLFLVEMNKEAEMGMRSIGHFFTVARG